VEALEAFIKTMRLGSPLTGREFVQIFFPDGKVLPLNLL
jgi:hypothetical protein